MQAQSHSHELALPEPERETLVVRREFGDRDRDNAGRLGGLSTLNGSMKRSSGSGYQRASAWASGKTREDVGRAAVGQPGLQLLAAA